MSIPEQLEQLDRFIRSDLDYLTSVMPYLQSSQAFVSFIGLDTVTTDDSTLAAKSFENRQKYFSTLSAIWVYMKRSLGHRNESAAPSVWLEYLPLLISISAGTVKVLDELYTAPFMRLRYGSLNKLGLTRSERATLMIQGAASEESRLASKSARSTPTQDPGQIWTWMTRLRETSYQIISAILKMPQVYSNDQIGIILCDSLLAHHVDLPVHHFKALIQNFLAQFVLKCPDACLQSVIAGQMAKMAEIVNLRVEAVSGFIGTDIIDFLDEDEPITDEILNDRQLRLLIRSVAEFWFSVFRPNSDSKTTSVVARQIFQHEALASMIFESLVCFPKLANTGSIFEGNGFASENQ